MSLKSGHQILPVAFEEAKKQYEHFLAYRSGTIRLEPDGWFLTTPYIEYAAKIYDFKFKASDVVIMTYPKSGTTWTQEIVWTIIHNPNLDNSKASMSVMLRCPFFESDFLMKGFPKDMATSGTYLHNLFIQANPTCDPKDGIFLQLAEHAEEPRIIKTHLPFSLLPPNLSETSKVIYVARNPKDVAVSYCHHSKLIKAHDFCGTTSEFVDHFVNDTIVYSPFWKHLREAWKRRLESNIHFIYYEDLKANPKSEITKISKFLNANLNESQIERIVSYTSFSEMKKRESGDSMGSDTNMYLNKDISERDGGFFRKGETGDYRNKLSEEDVKKIDEWTKENVQNFGNQFKYYHSL